MNCYTVSLNKKSLSSTLSKAILNHKNFAFITPNASFTDSACKHLNTYYLYFLQFASTVTNETYNLHPNLPFKYSL